MWSSKLSPSRDDDDDDGIVSSLLTKFRELAVMI
jgi:hypothetical protein